jgi:hypothetical protein
MFFLTLTYPMTILIFLGIFAGLGIGNTKGNYGAIAALVLGVFIGSILWWAILSGFIGDCVIGSELRIGNGSTRFLESSLRDLVWLCF